MTGYLKSNAIIEISGLTKWLDHMAFVVCSIFCFFLWLGTAFVYSSCGLLLIIFVLKSLVTEFRPIILSITKLALAWIGFVVISYFFTIISNAEAKPFADDQMSNWLMLAYFPLLGTYLHQFRRYIVWFLGLVATGFMIRIFMETDLDQIVSLFTQGRTYDFGMAQIAFGLYASIIVNGLVIYTPSLLASKLHWVLKYSLIILSVLSLIILLASIVIVNSRGVWITIIAGCLISTIWLLAIFRHDKNPRQAQQIILVFGLIAIGIVSLSFEKISKRVSQERHVIEQIIQGNLTNLPATSIGTRISLYREAIRLFKQKPWFGHGVGSNRYFLQGENQYDNPHFHNMALDILVQFGLTGFAFIMSILFLFVKGVFSAAKNHQITNQLSIFLITSWIMIIIWGMSDSRLTKTDMSFLIILLSSLCYACIRVAEEPVKS